MTSNVKITSDGSARGTSAKLINGSDIFGVRGLSFRHDAGDLPQCEIEIWAGQIELEAHACFMVTDPGTGETKAVKSMAFADGSEWTAP